MNGNPSIDCFHLLIKNFKKEEKKKRKEKKLKVQMTKRIRNDDVGL